MPNRDSTTSLPTINEAIMDELKAVIANEKPTTLRARDWLLAGVAKQYARLHYDPINNPLLLKWSIAITDRVQLELTFGAELAIGDFKGKETRTFSNVILHSAAMVSTVSPIHFIPVKTISVKEGVFDWGILQGFMKCNARTRQESSTGQPFFYIVERSI